MMEAALEGVHRTNNPAHLIAVTVLTSMNQATFDELGMNISIKEQVLKLAKLTQTAGLQGVVCSAKEARLLRQHFSPNFLLVTPGIRPINTNQDDQSRVVTPKEALNSGASYLVIGRPITQASNPVQALEGIAKEIKDNFK
jgi:orotidine-5'-phosphate decarboxylase